MNTTATDRISKVAEAIALRYSLYVEAKADGDQAGINRAFGRLDASIEVAALAYGVEVEAFDRFVHLEARRADLQAAIVDLLSFYASR